LKHLRIVALELLAQLATVAVKAKIELFVETSQFTQTNDAGIPDTNVAETMLIRA
jgi:hypothetical protein